MIEAQVLFSLLNHQAWLQYSSVLDWYQLKQQTPELHKVFLALKKWHEEKAADLTPEELGVWFFLCYPGMADKQKDVYQGILTQVAGTSIRQELVAQYLQQQKNTQIRRELAVLAIDDKTPNERLVEQVGKLLLQTDGTCLEVPTEYITTDLDELIQHEEDTPGLTWRLNCLNQSVGPLGKGQFLVVLARVETGKTALWLSEAAHMVGQIQDDEHIAVFFNEEDGKGVMWRFYSAVTGMTYEELSCFPIEAQELFHARGGQRLKFVDNASQHYTGITKILDTLNPRLIIIDNLDEVKGFERDERQDVGLGKLYRWARETAKTYAPVIGVCQSSITMQKKWLTEFDMANSKVAKPAALDALIAIGRTDDAGYENVRYINIPKNKRRGMRGGDEKLRHGRFTCTIQPELSRYRDA